MLGLVVGNYAQVWRHLFSDKSGAYQPLLHVVALLVGIQTVLCLYLTDYLPVYKKLDSSAWPVYCPRVIPIASGLGAATVLLLIRSCWPVWGMLTPLILGTEFMGCLFALHFVPWPFRATCGTYSSKLRGRKRERESAAVYFGSSGGACEIQRPVLRDIRGAGRKLVGVVDDN